VLDAQRRALESRPNAVRLNKAGWIERSRPVTRVSEPSASVSRIPACSVPGRLEMERPLVSVSGYPRSRSGAGSPVSEAMCFRRAAPERGASEPLPMIAVVEPESSQTRNAPST